MKINLNQRTYPFTLTLNSYVNIKTATSLIQMVERDNYVRQNLKMQLNRVSDDVKKDLKNVLDQIDEEKNPILKRFY